ncbi:MAG: AmmeMemoRadiSam system protein B, partial [Nitrosomonas sp.]|nr:AmmeMemoRadiSam system protein B [Nitrosomonas sp.]
LPGVDVFDTPLGNIELDQNLVNKIAQLPQICISKEAHVLEHSLEVQLPFLQSVLGHFTLLPLAVGLTSAEAVADVLAHVWGGEETLIIVSSDLSHYLPYSDAQRTDHETMQSIMQLEQLVEHERACGSTAINGLIVAAQQRHLTPQVLDLRNSGDTAGSRERVVGYAAVAFD